MKKFIVLIMALSTLLMAGGDFTKEYTFEVVPTQPVVVPETNFYAGVGYSCMQLTTDNPDTTETAMNAFSVQAGYNVFKNLDFEVRYTANIGDIKYKSWKTDINVNTNFSNVGAYLKPKVEVFGVDVYGLAGYGKTRIHKESDYGFQYGGGLELSVAEHCTVFGDYRRLQDGDKFSGFKVDNAVNSFTVGTNYKF